MASVEDRWTKANPNGARPKRVPRERYGQGLRWRVTWDEGGKRSKSFSTRDAADEFLLQVYQRTKPGVYARPRESLLVSEYAERWQAQQVHQRPSSRLAIERRVRLNIIPALGHKRLEHVTRDDVQQAVLAWSAGEGVEGVGKLKPSTVKLAYTYLSGMMKAAVLDGHIQASPCVGVRLPRAEVVRVRPLSTGDVQKIVDVIWAPYKPLVVFGAATGMRGAEMRGLTWDRVDLVKGSVTIDRQLLSTNPQVPSWGPPKTRSSVRTIRIGPDTVAMLKQLGPGDGLVFTSEGRCLTRPRASEAWIAARKKLPGIGDGYHQLRHYHASILVAGGMSPVAVAHRLGHKDVSELLNTYAHLWVDDDDRASELTDGVIFLERPAPG